MTIEDKAGALGFNYRVAKNGTVLIHHHGRLAATLRGAKATDFLNKVAGSGEAEQQQFMARVAGNYKRGNERQSRNHPRNR